MIIGFTRRREDAEFSVRRASGLRYLDGTENTAASAARSIAARATISAPPRLRVNHLFSSSRLRANASGLQSHV